MNTDELEALRERIATEQPGEIRLCCPLGHFIVALKIGANVTLKIGAAAGGPLTMWPGMGRGHHVRRRGIHFSEEARVSGRFPPENHGFVVDSGPNGLTVTLTCDRCPGWTLTRDYQRLAVELAVYALAGHREYRIR